MRYTTSRFTTISGADNLVERFRLLTFDPVTASSAVVGPVDLEGELAGDTEVSSDIPVDEPEWLPPPSSEPSSEGVYDVIVDDVLGVISEELILDDDRDDVPERSGS